MTILISTLALNAEAEAFISALDSGSLELRTGTQPASIDDAATGTLIATVLLPATALSAPATNGQATLAAVTEVDAVAAGLVGWGRFKVQGGGAYLDGSVTLTGGGGDIIATEVDLLPGDKVTIL